MSLHYGWLVLKLRSCVGGSKGDFRTSIIVTFAVVSSFSNCPSLAPVHYCLYVHHAWVPVPRKYSKVFWDVPIVRNLWRPRLDWKTSLVFTGLWEYLGITIFSEDTEISSSTYSHDGLRWRRECSNWHRVFWHGSAYLKCHAFFRSIF